MGWETGQAATLWSRSPPQNFRTAWHRWQTEKPMPGLGLTDIVLSGQALLPKPSRVYGVGVSEGPVRA